MTKKNTDITVRSSAAEYLTFVASTGDSPESSDFDRYLQELDAKTSGNPEPSDAMLRISRRLSDSFVSIGEQIRINSCGIPPRLWRGFLFSKTL